MNAKDIKEALALRYGYNLQNICLEEFRVGTGYGPEAESYLDFYTISMTNPTIATAFEIKVSKSDFMSEMKKPEKRRMGLFLSHLFYFVAPKGIIDISILPVECGLIECTENATGAICLRQVRAALHRDTEGPTWRYAAALARASSRLSTGSLEKQLKTANYELDKLRKEHDKLLNEFRFKDVYKKIRTDLNLPASEFELPTK